MRDLKKYDRKLNMSKSLDGIISIKRKSPFSATKNYDILTITNQFVGSFNWILKKLILMDHQRFDITGRAHAINRAIRHKKNDDRVTRDIADMFESGGNSIIL